MEAGVGATLREARNRRKIDLSEVEEATKIRLRFLRAMENEEWEVLPGGAYTRAFIRTYASYLGLDGERLADEYRYGAVAVGVERAPRVEPMASASPRTAPRPPGWVWVALVSVALIAIAIAVGLAGGGDDGSPSPTGASPPDAGVREGNDASRTAVRPGVAVRLQARAEVWVCLLNGREEPVIDGRILTAGVEEGPFRSGSFTISFGNGEVEMQIDGREAEIPVTSSPIGYEVGSDGELTELEEAERPTCA